MRQCGTSEVWRTGWSQSIRNLHASGCNASVSCVHRALGREVRTVVDAADPTELSAESAKELLPGNLVRDRRTNEFGELDKRGRFVGRINSNGRRPMGGYQRV